LMAGWSWRARETVETEIFSCFAISDNVAGFLFVIYSDESKSIN